jgi:mono/diheme cytochrome c family protein
MVILRKNRFASILVALLMLSGVYGCIQRSQETVEKPVENTMAAAELRGLQMLKTQCFSCHTPTAGGGKGRIAPPMTHVKSHYIRPEITKELFVSEMVAFLKNPSEENTKMPGAVRNFGLMPKMAYTDEDLAAVAAYIFDVDMSENDWVERAEKKLKGIKSPKTEPSDPIQVGLEKALGVKSVLGKNLLAAIQSGSAPHAVSFCNERAIPLTDSMSVAQNAKIRRVTDKPRNPGNLASAAEMEILASLNRFIAAGEKPLPVLQIQGTKFTGYYPITVDKMCLQCHGEPKTDILPQTLEKIQANYPYDKAVGYKENDLRGMWKVEWNSAAEK